MVTLSPRQHQIAVLVAEDLSNKQIAARLGMPLQTVKNTLTDIYRKLGVKTRVGVAVTIARESVIVRDMRGQFQAGRQRAPYAKKVQL